MLPFKSSKPVGDYGSTTLTSPQSYNKQSKACIPLYNIKASYNPDIKPFFSPRDTLKSPEDGDRKSDVRQSLEGLQ